MLQKAMDERTERVIHARDREGDRNKNDDRMSLSKR